MALRNKASEKLRMPAPKKSPPSPRPPFSYNYLVVPGHRWWVNDIIDLHSCKVHCLLLSLVAVTFSVFILMLTQLNIIFSYLDLAFCSWSNENLGNSDNKSYIHFYCLYPQFSKKAVVVPMFAMFLFVPVSLILNISNFQPYYIGSLDNLKHQIHLYISLQTK